MEKIRINKFLAEKYDISRRKADELVKSGKVFVNNKKAFLGDKVNEKDKIEINKFTKKEPEFYAYYKPRGLITHKQRKSEKDIVSSINLNGIFPIGRLDKDSEGLMILTNNGRITDKFLNPKYDHEKEYLITTRTPVKPYQLRVMTKGMDLEGGLKTKPAKTKYLDNHSFLITLSEGKKHQIRRMCDAFSLPIESLKRIRFMNVKLGYLKPGQYRKIEGEELKKLLSFE